MRDLSLFRATLGLPSSVNVLKPLKVRKPDSEIYFFLATGHVMESIEINSKKVVCLFFGPGEFVIPCHPELSILKSLDDVRGQTFTHRAILNLLRGFSETRVHYRSIRKEYNEKVAERLRVYELPVEKRLEHLQKKQPWVFGLVDRQDIASYLGISLSMFEKIRSK